VLYRSNPDSAIVDVNQAITRTEASAVGAKARAYIRLFSLRANHSNQGRRSGDVDSMP